MKNIFLILTLIFLLTNCDNNRYYGNYNANSSSVNSQSEEQDSINAKINRDEALEKIKKQPELANYIAQYRFTDKNDNIFDIFVTKEESSVIVDNNANVFYASYTDYEHIDPGIDIKPSNDSNLTIRFEGGNYEKAKGINAYIFALRIDGDWIYNKEYYSEKHPRWRLPIQMISGKPKKAKNSKKSWEIEEKSYTEDDNSNISEQERVGLETITGGYNKAAWNAYKRKKR